jgi:choline-sulfatase
MAEHISRRVFLRSAGAAAAALALPRFAWGDVQAGGERSNVLFIAVDDLNDWIGCLGGHPDTRTPNLDRLAARGVLFEQAHCSAPLCNPSRASLMTGIRPSSSGVYTNTQPWRPAMPDAVTLPQHFMAHGYEVMGSGKTFHDAFPDPPSWQRYWPGLQRQRPPDPMPPKRPLNGIPNAAQFDWGPIDAKDQDMGDWQVADWVRGELAKKHAKPFFLACGFFRPHLPWYVPGKYFDMFPLDKVTLPVVKKDDLSDVPPIGRQFANAGGDHARVIKTDNWSRAVQGYLASIAFSDACLGRVLEALDASEHAENTVVVLWGDHGWHLGEKGMWAKGTLFDVSDRVPLVIVDPRTPTAGQGCAAITPSGPSDGDTSATTTAARSCTTTAATPTSGPTSPATASTTP